MRVCQKKCYYETVNDCFRNCDTEKTTLSTLEEEAMAAVREHAFAVNLIGVSEMLPRTPQLLFINVTTSENHTHCIELTS